jgi:hypothetical protein
MNRALQAARGSIEPIWTGRHLDGAGVWHTVRSCDGHRAGCIGLVVPG